MIDKITLYREVLEIEPGSRVFFPLAKLLVEKAPAEAITVLKKGLTRHPDHIEARIFLIELLAANEGDADLDSELDIVTSILRNYPAFWKIWSAHLAQQSDLHDAALAINFFGAGLSGKSITWTEIIAKGLNALLVEEGDETTPLLPTPSLSTNKQQKASPAIEVAHILEQEMSASEDVEDEEGDEPFSLRTRTMAELLAEQGDFAEAIDIYQEILDSAPESAQADILVRLEELSALQQQAISGGSKKETTHTSENDGGKLVSLLESLASRFESRAE